MARYKLGISLKLSKNVIILLKLKFVWNCLLILKEKYENLRAVFGCFACKIK